MNSDLIIKDAEGNDLSFSKIIYGGSGLPFLNGNVSFSFLTSCVKAGLNTFDTARVYGNGLGEQRLGKWIKEENISREEIRIITKCCHPVMAIVPRVSKAAAFKDIEASLNALKVSYVDCLMLHRDNPLKRPEEIITFMNEIIQKGYAKTIGVSNWKWERIEQANHYAREHNLIPFSVSECQFSLGIRVRDPWHNGTLSLTGDDEKHRKEREYYINNKLPNLCYSSLGDGFFSGKVKADDLDIKKKLTPSSRSAYYSSHNLKVLARAQELAKKKGCSVATIALSYCLRQPFETSCIVSFSSLKRLEENMKAISLQLNKDEIDYLRLSDSSSDF